MDQLYMRVERLRRKWTLDYIGQEVNLSKAAVHDIEINRRKPSYEVLCKLEDLFNLTHRQLFTVVNDENE